MKSSFPMHVAVRNRHRKPAGYHFCIEWAGDSDDRDTLSGPASSNRQNLPTANLAARCPTSLGSAIVTGLPLWRNWRTAIERAPTRALAVRRFLQEYAGTGVLGFREFLGAVYRPLRSPSFRTLLQSFQESSGVNLILCRPSLSPVGFHSAETNKREKAACAPNQSIRSIK